jgi:hypothetical protein
MHVLVNTVGACMHVLVNTVGACMHVLVNSVGACMHVLVNTVGACIFLQPLARTSAANGAPVADAVALAGLPRRARNRVVVGAFVCIHKQICHRC